jgi:hypothetical protein
VKPVLQVKPHEPPAQTAVALATLVEHPCPQEPQLFGSVVVLVQPLEQRVGVATGQLDAHEYTPPEFVQYGVPPVHA